MIMWSGQQYPIYDLKPPAGMYGHVEPVIGIQSNHPLNDTTSMTTTLQFTTPTVAPALSTR
jgi:hypothetical protein